MLAEEIQNISGNEYITVHERGRQLFQVILVRMLIIIFIHENPKNKKSTTINLLSECFYLFLSII